MSTPNENKGFHQFQFKPGFLVPTQGMQLIAVVFSMYLLGIFSVQRFTYWRTYPHDPRAQKALVMLVWIAGTAHWAISFWPLWMSQVYYWGVCLDCGITVHMYSIQVMLSSLIVLVVQLWFLRRLWLLSNSSYWMTVPILVLNLAQCGSGLFVYGKDFNGWPVWVLESRMALILWNGTILQASIGLIADLLLAGLLWWQLQKCKTGRQDTDEVLRKAIHLTMLTTVVTSVILILTIIAFLVAPWESYGPACNIVLNHVYSNCFLYALNSRPTSKPAVRRSIYSSRSMDVEYAEGVKRHPTLTSLPSSYKSGRRNRSSSEPFTPMSGIAVTTVYMNHGSSTSREHSFSTHRSISEEEEDNYVGMAV